MIIAEELILRFFQGKCNREEAAVVLAYFEQYPAAAEQYMGKAEWNKMMELSVVNLSEERQKRMLSKIRSATYQKLKINVNAYRWAIAASLVILMFIALNLYDSKPTVFAQDVQSIQINRLWEHIQNRGEKVMNLVLKDGTEVRLNPHSQISFPQIFQDNKREVRLIGKAFFKVAKDKKRPFTVFCRGVSTTALGTQFTVEALKENGALSVKLYEGSVMIKILSLLAGKDTQPIYLSPNQEFIYEKVSGLILLKRFDVKPSDHQLSTGVKEMFTKQSGVNISFNREPLENVFLALSKAYQIDLIYPQRILKDHYFTGSFHKNDSLVHVLHILSETNKLNIIKIKSGFKITKQH